jgi:hypothetical protein
VCQNVIASIADDNHNEDDNRDGAKANDKDSWVGR